MWRNTMCVEIEDEAEHLLREEMLGDECDGRKNKIENPKSDSMAPIARSGPTSDVLGVRQY